MDQIKRFAGASAGAMTASLMAVGYNSKDIQGFLSQDMSKMFLGILIEYQYTKNYILHCVRFAYVHVHVCQGNIKYKLSTCINT